MDALSPLELLMLLILVIATFLWLAFKRGYRRPVGDKRFAILAVEFETLQKELQETNDPALRTALLTAIGSKLAQIESIAKGLREEFAKSR
jgi:hypothetical protein